MPPESTVRQWVVDDREGFAAQYAQARELGYQTMVDELLEIADDGTNDYTTRKQGDEDIEVVNHDHIARSRLRVDTRKWLLSKALPKVYGDKLAIGGDAGNPIEVKTDLRDMARSIVDVLRQAGKATDKDTQP